MTMTGQDATIYAGRTYELEVTVTDDDNDDAALDITGCDIYYVIVENGTVILSKSTDDGDGITITDAAGGVFQIAIDPADTEALGGKRKLYHEAALVDGAGNESTLFVGEMNIERSYAAVSA